MAGTSDETPGEGFRVILERRARLIVEKCRDPIPRDVWCAISRVRHEDMSWEEAATSLSPDSFRGIPQEKAIELHIELRGVAWNEGKTIVDTLAEADQEAPEEVPALEAMVRAILDPE